MLSHGLLSFRLQRVPLPACVCVSVHVGRKGAAGEGGVVCVHVGGV